MSSETPHPPETAPATATTPKGTALRATRAPGARPPLKVDMSKVPEPRWLKHCVTAIDIFAGVLCAIVVRWMGGDVLSLFGMPVDSVLADCILVAGIAALGWAIRRRAWAIAFVAGTVALPLGLLPLG